MGTGFHEVSPLTNNTAKTSVGLDLVKIRPAIAEQSHQKKKNQNTEWPLNRLVASPATVKSKFKSKSTILQSKSTLSEQVRVPVLFKEGKSKSTDHNSKSESKSSRKKRTCKQLCPIPVVFLLLLLYGNFTSPNI